MNIDMELEEARKGAYEAVVISVKLSKWAAVSSVAYSAREAACSATCSSESYNKERLKQLEMIKEIL